MNEAAFVARASRRRIAAALLLCLGFVSLGLWEAGAIGDLGADAVPWIGWPAAILFGAFFAFGLRLLAASGDVIRVDAKGIRWRRWSDATIPWDAVEHAFVRRIHRQPFLCLVLDDPAAHRSTRALGRLARSNAALGFGDVALNTGGTDQCFTALVEAVERFRPVEGG